MPASLVAASRTPPTAAPATRPRSRLAPAAARNCCPTCEQLLEQLPKQGPSEWVWYSWWRSGGGSVASRETFRLSGRRQCPRPDNREYGSGSRAAAAPLRNGDTESIMERRAHHVTNHRQVGRDWHTAGCAAG